MMPSIRTVLIRPLILLFSFAFSSAMLHAHPMAPGLFAIDQQDERSYAVEWKLPIKKITPSQPEPVWPDFCRIQGEVNSATEGTGRVSRFVLNCEQSLANSTFAVQGFDSEDAGVLLRISLKDGQSYHQMLNAAEAAYTVPERQSASSVISHYGILGIEHLVGGIDHVLFILILYLLIGWNRKLLWTVTLFTIGHSLTLSLTVLGIVQFPVWLVESLIAFSIVVAAAEWIRQRPDTLFKRWPGLASGGFGLLHGMGFAGVLSDIGLPPADIPLALASFNIGIELGQLGVLCVAAFIHRITSRSIGSLPAKWVTLPGYVLGTLAAFWFWQRLIA